MHRCTLWFRSLLTLSTRAPAVAQTWWRVNCQLHTQILFFIHLFSEHSGGYGPVEELFTSPNRKTLPTNMWRVSVCWQVVQTFNSQFLQHLSGRAVLRISWWMLGWIPGIVYSWKVDDGEFTLSPTIASELFLGRPAFEQLGKNFRINFRITLQFRSIASKKVVRNNI